MRSSLALAIVATLATAGCGATDLLRAVDGQPEAPPSKPPVLPTPSAEFGAVINGVPWVAAQALSVTRNDGTLEITTAGTHFSELLSAVLKLTGVSGPGVYHLSRDSNGSSLVVALTDRVALGWDFTWGTSFGSSHATITITTLTANRIVGTFTATLSTATAAAEDLNLAAGRFNFTF